jgi:hypothetical protein
MSGVNPNVRASGAETFATVLSSHAGATRGSFGRPATCCVTSASSRIVA